MTFYELSVITNTGFPYYQLRVKDPPKNVKLFLRFFDFSENKSDPVLNLDPISSFELNAGLVSALFEFARNLDKKIEILEFNSNKEAKYFDKDSKYNGDVLITIQTEPYLLHKSVHQKIKLIYNSIIVDKIPLDSALEILQNEEDLILDILLDKEARDRIQTNTHEISKLGNNLLSEMKDYGLNGICVTSFDLSPIIVFGKKYSLNDTDTILRHIGIFPEIPPMEWIYRQSFLSQEQIWVYIIKSGVGPTVNGLFEPYFYLLFAEPQSYLGEFPGTLAAKFNQILG
ncbi:MAG: hypothetical protein ACXACC_07970 [Promethearchaeota archaeon]|jgi:hypothetical protein